MKYIKLFEQYLFEYEIFDYKLKAHADNEWRYEFTVDVDEEVASAINSPYPDKLLYTCTVWHDRSKHYFNMYEAEFGVKGQKHPGESVGLDMKHFNSVLYTCGEIIDEVVKQQLIGTLRVQGAGGDKDMGINQFINPNIRAKIYKRWAERRYGKSNVKSVGSFMDVDMKSARPKLFKGQDKTKELIDVVDKYMNTDKVYDRKELERNLTGFGTTNFDFNSDAINHKEYGTLYVEIVVFDKIKDYSLSVEFMDGMPDKYPDGINEYFKNFNQLINYIKKF